ncbi:hypothetical protein LuPra_05602 [Luteitalea pratensis]|uniref:Uncharacterized protein n=1 Tax=Luteitalea pratensis TaxID=1855912 RepID=A0A143PX13_LUTPR|nr:hypothetical protein [Luteitalea pratensis]AMY12329.1 hypothetical protein LuPra_05602 [Luteitalea pratensis]
MTPTRRAFWSLYILSVLALGFGRTAEKVVKDSGGLLSRYGPLLGAIVIAVGVVGYLSSRPIGRAWVWKGVFVLTIVGVAGLLALEAVLLRLHAPTARIHAMTLAAAMLLAAAIPALHRDAFRSPATWRPSPPTVGLSKEG